MTIETNNMEVAVHFGLIDEKKKWMDILTTSHDGTYLYERAKREIDRLDFKIQRNINRYVVA